MAHGAPRESLDDNSPVPVPASGAYLGAWTAPDQTVYTKQDRLRAVASFETKIHRTLDIVHTYRQWDDPTFSDSDLAFIGAGYTLLYSWAGTDTRTIVAGQEDDVIRQRADDIRAMGRPILLEWRWEMDRPNLRAEEWSGTDYIAAWKHIRAIFNQEGVTNASWVWCPTAAGFDDGTAQQFYPGDSQVDWICVDAYPDNPTDTLAGVLAPFLQWASSHHKPIIIGEYGVPRSLSPPQRAAWLREAAATFEADAQIKAVCYFDADPVRHRLAREWAIHDDPAAMQAFATMADDPYFNPNHRTIKP